LLEELIRTKSHPAIFPFIRPIKPNIHIDSVDTSQQKPILSIVIPFFNMGKYVKDTITSIFDSTYKNIEIIIVNDGSTEKESIEVLEKLRKNDSIKIIDKNNEGLSLARNLGAQYAKGEYLAFLDPDDTIENQYYEKALDILHAYKNIHFVGCWAKYFGKNTGYWPTFNPEPPYLLIHNMINSSALIYKKKSFLKSGLNDSAMIYGMEDYESVINMVRNGYQGVVLPEPLWNYRIRKDSMARAFTKEKQLYLYSLITDKHKDFYSTFGADITKLLNANGSGINYDNPTLTYDMLGRNWLSSDFNQILIRKIKSNSFIRKIAIKIFRIYKK